jgi:toxin YoeB
MGNRKLSFTKLAWEDYLYWQRESKRILKRINALLKDIERNPYEGIGKPELLTGDLAGYWSRRIDEKNRIVYKMTEEFIEIEQCRTHYVKK